MFANCKEGTSAPQQTGLVKHTFCINWRLESSQTVWNMSLYAGNWIALFKKKIKGPISVFKEKSETNADCN